MKDERKPCVMRCLFSSFILHPSSLLQWNGGESNPDLLFARQAPSPPRPLVPFFPFNPVESQGIAPRFPACDAGVFLLDDDPIAVTSVGIEPTRLAAAGSQPTLATSYS